jgi:hypothetical protein
LSRRRLAPIASDADRIEAARIMADRLTAELREAELVRATWQERPPAWTHYIDSAGSVYSLKEP